MADFKPKKLDLTQINGGKEYEDRQGIQPIAINAPIEASAWVQMLAETQPDFSEANNVGTPSVSIEYDANGYPYFKFANLKGEVGIAEGESFLTKTEADETYVKKSSANRCVYGRDKNAEKPIILDYANTAEVNHIPFRGLNGSLYIPTKSIQEPGAVPAGQQAINKDYVDKLPDYLTLTDDEKTKWCDMVGAVKKETSTDTKLRLYAVNPDGSQTVVKASAVREGNQIVRYSADGRVDVGDPYWDYQATNKKYVDGKIAELLARIEALENK